MSNVYGFSFSNGGTGPADALVDWYAGGDVLGRTLSHWYTNS
jgi:hypothetical protein